MVLFQMYMTKIQTFALLSNLSINPWWRLKKLDQKIFLEIASEVSKQISIWASFFTTELCKRWLTNIGTGDTFYTNDADESKCAYLWLKSQNINKHIEKCKYKYRKYMNDI